MLMTAVIQPDVFDQSHFTTPGYRDQAETLLRGLISNALILSDPNCRLLRELIDRAQLLRPKEGQQIRIRLEELQKNRRSRVVIAERTRCSCPTSLSTLETCCSVHSCLEADTLILDAASRTKLLATGAEPNRLTLLSEYISSNFEQQRRDCLEEMPPIDQMAPGEFEQHLIRLVRFSRRLRLFDKQIGKGSVGGFRTGIGRILALWVKHSHYPRSELNAEIYTCVRKTHEPPEVIHNRILDNLIQRLVAESQIPISLYFKEDDESLTHDRFLQTDFMPVSFSKGFDFLKENGSLDRCSIRIENGAYDHLQQYRNLKDHLPPAKLTPS